ncbi:MAG: deoxyribose-phosphate aldolase [Scrofimicrobium sp.]
MAQLTATELAQYFDHTLLRTNATDEEFRELCDEAREYGFKMVAINPYPVEKCKEMLQGTDVHVGAAIGFPLGQTTIETKVFETTDALENGADEIDYVVNQNRIKAGDYAYIQDEMEQIVSICRKHGATSKVIFENCYLTDDEKIRLCGIANQVGPDFIKTATGFGTGGAALDDVKLMRKHADRAIKVKASGGVRTLHQALEMIAAGVERIGSTSSVAIMDEFNKRNDS